MYDSYAQPDKVTSNRRSLKSAAQLTAHTATTSCVTVRTSSFCWPWLFCAGKVEQDGHVCKTIPRRSEAFQNKWVLCYPAPLHGRLYKLLDGILMQGLHH